MSEPPELITTPPVELQLSRERTKRVKSVGTTAGVSAFFAVIALSSNPTWPMAAGVASVAAMVALVCYGLIKQH